MFVWYLSYLTSDETRLRYNVAEVMIDRLGPLEAISTQPTRNYWVLSISDPNSEAKYSTFFWGLVVIEYISLK